MEKKMFEMGVLDGLEKIAPKKARAAKDLLKKMGGPEPGAGKIVWADELAKVDDIGSDIHVSR